MLISYTIFTFLIIYIMPIKTEVTFHEGVRVVSLRTWTGSNTDLGFPCSCINYSI